MKLLYGARIARWDLLKGIQVLSTRVTKWNVSCDRALHRLVCYVACTANHVLVGFVGDGPDAFRLRQYADADVAGDWTEECSVAFAKLKLDVATAAAITPYDTERQAILMIDSCKEGTAGVLSQSYGNRLRPVSFFSRAWTGSEQSASPQLSELKGLVSCCLHWKQFLWGQKVGISILSDHGSLKY